MILNNTRYRRKICVFCSILTAVLIALCFRLFYLMIVKGDYYSKKASALQERERDIAGIRGDIVDRNDDGSGTLKRWKKKSFGWYQNVIAKNGREL